MLIGGFAFLTNGVPMPVFDAVMYRTSISNAARIQQVAYLDQARTRRSWNLRQATAGHIQNI